VCNVANGNADQWQTDDIPDSVQSRSPSSLASVGLVAVAVLVYCDQSHGLSPLSPHRAEGREEAGRGVETREAASQPAAQHYAVAVIALLQACALRAANFSFLPCGNHRLSAQRPTTLIHYDYRWPPRSTGPVLIFICATVNLPVPCLLAARLLFLTRVPVSAVDGALARKHLGALAGGPQER